MTAPARVMATGFGGPRHAVTSDGMSLCGRKMPAGKNTWDEAAGGSGPWCLACVAARPPLDCRFGRDDTGAVHTLAVPMGSLVVPEQWIGRAFCAPDQQMVADVRPADLPAARHCPACEQTSEWSDEAWDARFEVHTGRCGMTTYRVSMQTRVWATIEVEADSEEGAINEAYEQVPSEFCAPCMGWGQSYRIDMDEWGSANDATAEEVQP